MSQGNITPPNLPALKNSYGTETLYVASYPSPLGNYTLVSSQEGAFQIMLATRAPEKITRWGQAGFRIDLQDGIGQNRILRHELEEYFAGKRRHFTPHLDLRGTEFQLRVWNCIQSIPYGETRSYGEVAKALGQDTAARAIGNALSKNPLPIVLPCHRVISTNGELTGYADGLERKAGLLALETAARRRSISQ